MPSVVDLCNSALDKAGHGAITSRRQHQGGSVVLAQLAPGARPSAPRTPVELRRQAHQPGRA